MLCALFPPTKEARQRATSGNTPSSVSGRRHVRTTHWYVKAPSFHLAANVVQVPHPLFSQMKKPPLAASRRTIKCHSSTVFPFYQRTRQTLTRWVPFPSSQPLKGTRTTMHHLRLSHPQSPKATTCRVPKESARAVALIIMS
jgi:hypothetical protein